MSGGEPRLHALSGDGWGDSSVTDDSEGDKAFLIHEESFVSEYSTAPSFIA